MSQSISPQLDRSLRWQFSLRDLLTFTAAICVQLAAYLSVFRGFQASGKPASFFMGLLPPIASLVVVLIVNPLRARRYTRSALYRLPLETHRQVWLAFTFIPPAVEAVLKEKLATNAIQPHGGAVG